MQIYIYIYIFSVITLYIFSFFISYLYQFYYFIISYVSYYLYNWIFVVLFWQIKWTANFLRFSILKKIFGAEIFIKKVVLGCCFVVAYSHI